MRLTPSQEGLNPPDIKINKMTGRAGRSATTAAYTGFY